MNGKSTYRALVGERTFDIRWQGETLFVNDEPTTYAFEQVSGRHYLLIFNGNSIPVVIDAPGDGSARITLNGRTTDVRVKDERALLMERFGLDAGDDAAQREVRAPMPGLVLRVEVAPGQTVKTGEAILVLEAMKMENELRAGGDGVVKAIHVEAGTAVAKNDLLLEFE